MSLLKDVLNAIQSLQQHQDRGSEESFVAEHRNCLTFLVNHVLTDLNKRLNSTKASEEFDIALSMLEHCQNIFQIFSFRDGKCKDFTFWLQSRLVRIYTSPKHSVHHDKTVSVHATILAVIKETDNEAFTALILKLIQLLADFCAASQAGEPINCGISDVDYVAPHSGSNNPLKEQSMTKIDLEISLLAQLEPAQSSIMKLFMMHMPSIFKLVEGKCLENLISSLCWQIEFSCFTIKSDTCKLLAKMLETEVLFEKIPHLTLYQLMACMEVVTLHALSCDNQYLKESVTLMLKSVAGLPPHRSIAFSSMLIESVTDSSFASLTECELVSSLFDLLVSSTSTQAIVSMALSKQLVEWIITKLQSRESVESLIFCLGDLIKRQEVGLALVTLTRLCNVMSDIAQRRTENADDAEEMNIIRSCCQILAHSYLNLTADSSDSPNLTEFNGVLDKLSEVLTARWRSSLQAADPETVGGLYVDIVHGISSLLTLKDKLLLNKKMLRLWIIVISLPWIKESQTALHDLDVSLSKDLVVVAGTLRPRLSDLMINTCLVAVLVFDKEISPKWRVHVLRTVANNKRPLHLSVIVSSLHWLILNEGQGSHHLVYDLVHPMLTLQSSIVDEALAKALGTLSCIMAGKVEVKWPGVRCKTPSWQLDCVYCRKCDKVEKLNILDKVEKQSSHYVDPGMFEPFIQLVKKDNDAVRVLMAESLTRLFSHIKIFHANGDTMNMLNTSLTLLSDSNREVRAVFSNIPHRAFMDSSMEVIGQFVDQILKINATTQDEAVKETLIMTASSLGQLKDENLLAICIRYLVEGYLSANQVVSQTAFNHLQKLAESRGLTPLQIYQRNQSLLAECLSEKVVEIQSTSYTEGLTVMHLFVKSSQLFHYESPNAFLKSLEKHIIPYLITNDHSDVHQVLKLLANQVGKTYNQLLTKNIKYIFSHLIRFCDRATFGKKIAFLESESRLTIGNLLRKSFQGVLNYLLLYFGSRHQQIKLGLSFFLTQDRESNLTPGNHVSDEQLSDYIEKHLLGVLLFFDQTLLQKSSDLRNKENVMRSLIQIIKLLGTKRITPLRIKVSTSLKLSLTTTTGTFPKLCCEAWLCFVQHIEVTSLKPMLSFIVVTLLQLLRTIPSEVAEVFKYLVIKCRKQLSSSFNELYFIPEIPQLAEVNAVLKNYMVYSGRPDTFPLQLKQYLTGIKHDNMEVSKQALSKLKTLLMESKSQLYQMINGAETVDPLITETMLKLTGGCVKADDEMKLLYADCLAELGAIDPGKMVTITPPEVLNHRNVVRKNLDEINSPAFVMDYIELLITELLSAETTRGQDCIALAIQGAVSLFDVRNDESNEIWQSLSTETQDIIAPYMGSKYVVNDPNWLKVDSPVYMSSSGQVFTEWLCRWTALLASKVNNGFALQLFRSNMAAISASVNLAVFILPYIITYIIAEDQHTDLVRDEIMVIVEDAQKDEVSEFCHVTLQTVFSALDDLQTWLNRPKPKVSRVSAASKDNESESLQKVRTFLDGFPHDQIARASLNCKNYARSLLHYEHHMEGDDIQKHLDTLQEIYAAMDEPDGVSGVDSIREKPATLHQQAVVWENVDKLRDAMVCYEEAININPTDLSAHEGLMKCYLNLGNWYLALSHTPTNTSKEDHSLLSSKLISYKVEAAWKLGNWDILREMISQQDSSSQSWGVGVGRLILAAKDKHQEEFNDTMSQLKKDIMGPLCAASMEGGSLQRGYSYLVQLHMLSDIEAAAKLCLFKTEKREASLKTLLTQWDTRFEMVQSSVRTTEPLVTLRQSLLLLTQEALPKADLKQQLQRCWLERASIARKANQLVNAYGSLEKAARYGLAEREVEKAKLFWHRGDGSHAQTCLGRIINSHYDRITVADVQQKARSEQIAHAEVYLLYAWYNEGNSKFERAEVMKHYKKAIEFCTNWETAHFRLAVYYDKYLSSRPQNVPFYWRVYKQTAHSYSMAVRCGSKNVYHSMSRAISLWLDLGSDIAAKLMKERLNNEAKDILKKQQETLTLLHSECIEPMLKHAAGFQWLTAFSQLVSRLCHAHTEVTNLLQEIIASLIVQYPQQTVWNMMAISKSSVPIRLQRCLAIFEKAKSKSPALHIFFRDIIKLTDRLLELTNKSVPPKVVSLSLTENFKFLKRLLDDPNFSEIMLPGQSAMTVTLPAESDITGIPQDHKAFPTTTIYLKGFQDKVDVLTSMIRPKKLTMIGSNGKSYPFLCKPKDDLRKDGRLMELNDIINKLLRRDAESRRMHLYIKTYAVIPLNEECGLLEWINNTCCYRTILNNLYREKGCYHGMTECVNVYKAFNNKSPVDVRIPIFRECRDKYPPILHHWFLRNFPDPTSWYNARVTYGRTLAVMSVVGYIVGLGDRHGENMLLDSTTGGVMHVDFNCLFNKGLTFDWPEVVPFRLTHNMVAAMGPMGYEGIFRKAAEVTLRVMKQEKDQLMSILRPFIYDPLVEWSKPQTSGKRKGKHSDTGEATNEQAMTHVKTIEDRLTEGEAGQEKGLWLSTEGHVQDLISEATDEKNLARMYVGWAAYF